MAKHDGYRGRHANRPTLLLHRRKPTNMNQDGDKYRHLAELMRLAQSGDTSAYGELLRQVTPMLRRFVGSRYRSLQAADIEDLVQDALLSMHSVRATYDYRRPFLPWLHAIARNRTVDGARRYARRAANEVLVDTLPETFPEEQTNSVVNAYGDPEALKRAIADLPAGQRDAVAMLKLRQMSLKEAAVASGMSISALKVATHRGLKALRKALRSED